MKKLNVSQNRSTPLRRRPGSRRRRIGGVLTAELIITMPIVVGLIFAVVEVGMILVAQQQIENAARIGCRVGTLPAEQPAAPIPPGELSEHEQAVRNAVIATLANDRLIGAVEVDFVPGQDTGDLVKVEITLPMEKAAPDMLAFLGFSLEGHSLTAKCVMRRE